ncbi:biotin--[acetyl-CoA-carboxylase] ligase [Pseudogemmobacter sonorensis]|uniref:biotin--[acetyl-CoA-carboxylase] ligase n=1 Tax=Pseudogemmobacter sonorensis TaxID=2989681 RepID=UPI00368D69D6
MAAALQAAARVHLAAVDSTNAECFRRAPGLRAPLWVLADEQTAGRGRRARAWASPRGNFYASLVQRLDDPPARLGLRSFTTALALYDAFAEVTGMTAPFALKWPNDVLLNGGKISGILLEASEGLLVIGIGVNLIGAPPPEAVEPGAVAPVSLLAETGLRIAPARFLDALAPAVVRHEAVLRVEGFEPIRAAFLARAARLGERIRARTGRETREGIFETIDGDGNLILREGAERRAIPAADVFF